MKQALLLNELTTYLHQLLLVDRFPASEQGGVCRPSEQPFGRLGLALEPSPRLAQWVRSEHLDALWLHRPWRLDLATIPPNVGILWHHLPFDEFLTTGYNPHLADLIGLANLKELGYKQSPDELGDPMPPRPIGMLGNALPRPFHDWESLVKQHFGGYDRAELGREANPGRVAVVGAMNPALIQEAHERGIELYLTGEYRTSAQEAIDDTGMAVIAIGHRRTEEWGLRMLGRLLRDRWRELRVFIG